MKIHKFTIALLLAASFVSSSYGQNELTEKSIPVDLALELKTSHIWRGIEVTDNLLMDANVRLMDKSKTFALGIWGASTFTQDFKEFDYYVGFYKSGFSLEVWDVLNFSQKNQYGIDNLGGYNTEDAFNYKARETGHFVDVRLNYNFGESFPLKLGWNTVVFGRDRAQITDFGLGNSVENYTTLNKIVSKNRYSTYVEADYQVLKGDIVDVNIGVAAAFALKQAKIGGEKIKGNFYGDKDGFANASLTVSKNLKFSNNYNLPISVTAVWNTFAKKTYLQVAMQVVKF